MMPMDTSMIYTECKSVVPSLDAANSALLSLDMLKASQCARAWCYATSPPRKET